MAVNVSRWLAAMVLLALVVRPALADSNEEEAKKHYAAGNEHYNLGQYEQALAEFQAAYKAAPLSAFLFNIAQCHRKLGDYKQAIHMYQSYLTQNPNAENREVVNELIAESQTSLGAEQKRRERELAARREQERRRAEEARARQLEEQRRAREMLVQEEREKQYDRHPARTWALISMGVGGAAILAGAGVALSARSAQNTFDDLECGDPGALLIEAELSRCREAKSSGSTRAAVANILVGVGLAVTAGGAAVFVVDPGNIDRPQPGAAQLRVTPASIELRATW